MTIKQRVRAVATAAAIALTVGAAGVAQASAPAPAAGTLSQTAITSFELRLVGPNTIIEQTAQGSVSGTLSGNIEDRLMVVMRPDGQFTAQAWITCQCTVGGDQGVLELRWVDTGGQAGPDTLSFQGSAAITGANGELSGLSGVFEVEGTVDLTTGLATATYSGQIHSQP
jgi:hypothetical protein